MMTTLEYKADWEEARQHYLAWWAGEPFERCALAVTAPLSKRPVVEPLQPPDNPLKRWTDLDYIAARNEYEQRTTFYGGEAFPIWHGGYPGHTSMPAYLGCQVTLDEHTGWWDPILNGESWDIREIKFDPENRWWKFTLEQLQRGIREAAGKSIPDIGPALAGVGDVLAALRGTDRLLLDVALKPDQVRDAEFYLLEIWGEVFNHLSSMLKTADVGSTSWFKLWAPGRFYPTMCDFSYMISPRMFQNLFLPVIEQWTMNLDQTVYHVDGVDAFRHIPALTELPRIQAFQILPGDGKPGPLYYLDTLRQVQAKGKNLHISIAADEVENALSLLSARGLFIETSCETEEQARYLLKMAEKWSRCS